MQPIYDLSNHLEMRWINPKNPTGARGAGGQTNFGRKGSPTILNVQPGQTLVLAEGEGRGTIRHLWITLGERSPKMLRGCVIRFYWDGATTPAVEAPLADFFACPLGRMSAFASQWFDTAEGRNFNCLLPMPFRKGFRVTVTNESDDKENMQYTMYRFHGPDPICFQSEIRVTIQQIGYMDGQAMRRHRAERGLGGLLKTGDGSQSLSLEDLETPVYGLFERQDDWSATAYFYLDAPENDLPAIEDYASRVAALLEYSGASARIAV